MTKSDSANIKPTLFADHAPIMISWILSRAMFPDLGKPEDWLVQKQELRISKILTRAEEIIPNRILNYTKKNISSLSVNLEHNSKNYV